MTSLSAPQATLLVALLSFASGAAGWLLKRWWTGSSKHETAGYLNSVADLAGKLRAQGMTLEDVRQLETIMRDPRTAASVTAKGVVKELADEEPEAFLNNYAMKSRTGAAYSVAEAKLSQALVDLRLLLSPEQERELMVVQDRWQAYRSALQDFERGQYSGGTHAPLAAAFVGLSETERRTAEILAQVTERSNR